MRVQGNLLNWINLMLPVQSPSAKIFQFPFDPNHLHIPRRPVPPRGAFRDRHGRGAGCGGRKERVDEGADLADGEAVWSRRPDAGVKLAMMLRITPAMVANKPGHQGERGGNR